MRTGRRDTAPEVALRRALHRVGEGEVALAEQALCSAQLLAGELPLELEEVLAAAPGETRWQRDRPVCSPARRSSA